MTLTIAIASDHAGYDLKTALLAGFDDISVTWVDLGTDSATQSVDYPDYGRKISDSLSKGEADFGVAICGSGVGISIAVNRHPASRCVLCADETTARLSRQHNNANVIAFGARLIGIETAKACLKTFLTTAFDGGRHEARVNKLSTC